MLTIRRESQQAIFFSVELDQDGKTCFFPANFKLSHKLKNRKKRSYTGYKEEFWEIPKSKH